MTALASYSTGTVSVSAGGTTVTSVGAIWSGVNARPGDILQIGNFQTIISDVVDTDTLTIPPWGGGAQSGLAYKIWQVSPQRFAGAQAMADVNRLVAALNTNGVPVIVPSGATEPDPSLGEEDQYAIQPGTYKFWLKTGGLWVYQGIYKGLQLKGAWDSGTAYTVGDVATLSGSSYVCVSDHTNQTPPNVTYWQLLASKGNPGADGADGATGPTGAGYGGTSTTSLAIGTGSKAFATQAGLAYQNGARVRASSAADTSNWMEGLASYSGTSLTINVDKTNGSGTLADWNLNVVGQPGAGDLSSANNLSDLSDAEIARGNLGLTESIVTATVGQLPGTTGTTQPGAGMVAERISVTGTAALTSSVAANVASITPTAGVWDLEMVNAFTGPGATTSSDWTTVMSTVNASTGSGIIGEGYHTRLPSGADMSIIHSSRRVRVTTNGSTTYYLNARAVYSGASYGCGGTIQATRVS